MWASVPVLFPDHWVHFQWPQTLAIISFENRGCVSRSSWVSAGLVSLAVQDTPECVTGCIIATAGSHSLSCCHHLQNQCSSPAFVLLLGWLFFYRGGCWHWGGEWQAKSVTPCWDWGLPATNPAKIFWVLLLPPFCTLCCFWVLHTEAVQCWDGSYGPTFAWQSSQSCRRGDDYGGQRETKKQHKGQAQTRNNI